MPNHSFETDGTEDPTRRWMQHRVKVRTHPEWGEARVMRWYPAAGGLSQRLRIMADNSHIPQIVSITDVEIVS